MIRRLFRRRAETVAPLGNLVRHRRIGVNTTGDAIEVARNRLTLGAGIFAVAFAVISLRLVDVTLLRDGAEPELSSAARGGSMLTERAEIVDRNGVVLATSLPTASLYANPRLVIDPDEAARKLAAVLPGQSREELAAKLKSDRSFVWIKRNLPPREQYQVNRLGIPGIDFQREERRVYPQAALTAHAVGYAGVDNTGLAGAEQAFDAALRNGERVTLSLDVRLQRIVTQELTKSIEKFSAIGASGLILDVRTGEILAMVSLPGFDPNLPRSIDDEVKFNRVTLGVYEMGSTFKIFNTAMALDSGRMGLGNSFDATEPLRIGGFTINDDHPQRRWLTVQEIMRYSSNIGSARMALELGGDYQRAFFEKMGFLKPVRIELPESGWPLYPSTWRKINVMTIAFGHGIAVTPLHLGMGVAGVVNKGIMVPPTLLKRPEGVLPTGTRIINPNTAQQMRGLMRLVVEEGTGRRADVPGYLVGGKTGTSEKVGERGGYRKKSLLTSFVAAFPMNDPRYVVLVNLDEPKGLKETFNFATAGWNAAPTVGAIISRMAPTIGMPPAVQPAPADGGSPTTSAPRRPAGPGSQGGRAVASN